MPLHASRKLATPWLVACILLVPVAALSIYLWLSRWPTHVASARSDNLAFAVCIVIGAALIFYLPFRLWIRGVIAAAYVPLSYSVLFLYALVFVGVAFGDWL